MKIPLIPDLTYPKWLIIQELFKAIGTKRSRKIASRLKIFDTQTFIDCMKILILADTFELEYSYVISEIERNIELKKLLELKNEYKIEYLYKFVSKLDNKSLDAFFRNIFKIAKGTRERGRKYVIIDTTSLPIDINTWRKKAEIGKNKKYKWSFSPSEGYYVGYKLIMAIDALNYEIMGFEIYEGSPSDSKILEEFVEKLCNSRRLKKKDLIICDRGFPSLNNFHILINRFFLVPMIFLRKNTNINRIIGNLAPPLDIWNGKKYLLEIWKSIIREITQIIELWHGFREIRSNIELFFDIAKNCISLKKIHQFTKESVLKRVIRDIHLTFGVIQIAKSYNIGIRELAKM